MDFDDMELLRQINPKSFLEAACRHYGIEKTKLSVFMNDYDLFPRDTQSPSGFDPVPLPMREIAKRIGLPVKVVGRLQDTGVIARPITCDDFEFLKSYEKTWGNFS